MQLSEMSMRYVEEGGTSESDVDKVRGTTYWEGTEFFRKRSIRALHKIEYLDILYIHCCHILLWENVK